MEKRMKDISNVSMCNENYSEKVEVGILENMVKANWSQKEILSEVATLLLGVSQGKMIRQVIGIISGKVFKIFVLPNRVTRLQVCPCIFSYFCWQQNQTNSERVKWKLIVYMKI